MTAAAVSPGPGVADARGRFELIVDGDTVCASATADAAVARAPGATLVAAVGAAGETGETVLDFGAPTASPGGDGGAAPTWDVVCVPVDAAQLASLQASTDAFYSEIRTDDHPDGAVRGQWISASLFDLELDAEPDAGGA